MKWGTASVRCNMARTEDISPKLIEELYSLSRKVGKKRADHFVQDAIERLRVIVYMERETTHQRSSITSEGTSSEELLSAAMLMDELKIGKTYLNDIKQIGAIPFRRIGKGDKFLRSDVEQFKSNMGRKMFAQDVNRKIAKRREQEKKKLRKVV